MEDVGKSAWKQKDFHHALVFCLENLNASNLEGGRQFLLRTQACTLHAFFAAGG